MPSQEELLRDHRCSLRVEENPPSFVDIQGRCSCGYATDRIRVPWGRGKERQDAATATVAAIIHHEKIQGISKWAR